MADESQEKNKDRKSTSGSSRSSQSSSRGGRSRGGSSRSNYQRRRFRRRKVCVFCADKTKTIDWKEVDGLRRFIADSGSMHPRRKTGVCAKHQRRVAAAIKRARHLALLPYTTEHVRIMSKS